MFDRAIELTQNHRLRGYDAVQLASALVVVDVMKTGGLPLLTFVAGDGDLLRPRRPSTYPLRILSITRSLFSCMERIVLMTTVGRRQLVALRHGQHADPDAFMVINPSHEVLGGGFKPLSGSREGR